MPSSSLSKTNSVFEALNLILSEKVKLECDLTTPTNKKIKLKETAQDSKLKSVQLEHFSGPIVAFKLDGNKPALISNVLSAKCKDIHKGCDGIIFTELSAQKYIFVCELKSENPSGYINQMKNTCAFICYLNELLKTFSEHSLDDFKIVKILFSCRRRQKTFKDAFSPEKKHDNCNNFTFWDDPDCGREVTRSISNYLY